MTRLMRVLILLLLLLGAAPLAPVHAQDAAPDAGSAAGGPALRVADDSAKADFPNGITFTLDAETDNPVTNVELVYRAPGVDTYSVELPSFETGATALHLEQPVDLRAGQLPPGIDVDYHWRITEQNGDVVETPEQTLLWEDTRYEWTPLAGPHVTVYTYNADQRFQQTILDTAERTIGNLGKAYGVTPGQPIRIWAYASKQDLYGALAPNSEPWIAGAAYPGLHLIQAILPPGNYSEVARVVPHEISHQVLHQATKNPFNSPPQWLDEGLATYWQETGRDRFYTYALHLAKEGQIPPLRTLNGDFGYARDGATAAYALSLSAVMYILDTWGDDGMARLIATFPEGVTYDDAIQQSLGISFDELDRRWREDLTADAQQLGAAGSTRFGDDGPDLGSPWAEIGQTVALASGTLILGFVVLIAVVIGTLGFLRARRRPAPDDDDLATDEVVWRDWPEGLEPPGRRAHSL